MSQAEKPNNTSRLSRRTVLAGVSLTAAPMAVAVDKSVAGMAAEPIFAVIEAFDRVMSQEFALYRENDRLQEALPDEQTTWAIHFGRGDEGRWPPEGCTDAPEWIKVQLAMGEVTERQSDLMVALLTTAPTTIEGVIALLERLGLAGFPEERDLEGAELPLTTAREWYDERVNNAAEAFPFTLAAALREIIAA
jgi:hypothetical protein